MQKQMLQAYHKDILRREEHARRMMEQIKYGHTEDISGQIYKSLSTKGKIITFVFNGTELLDYKLRVGN